MLSKVICKLIELIILKEPLKIFRGANPLEFPVITSFSFMFSILYDFLFCKRANSIYIPGPKIFANPPLFHTTLLIWKCTLENNPTILLASIIVQKML